MGCTCSPRGLGGVVYREWGPRTCPVLSSLASTLRAGTLQRCQIHLETGLWGLWQRRSQAPPPWL